MTGNHRHTPHAQQTNNNNLRRYRFLKGLLLLIHSFKSKAIGWKMISYERTSILGRGGYGTVFEGELMNQKDNTKRRVAIRRNPFHDKRDFERQSQSFQLLMNLDHPNVIQLFHIKEDGDFM